METHREDEDVTKVTKEFYVVKLKKDNEEYFWSKSNKIRTNYTKELKFARKYKDYDTAKEKARQICGANNIVTYVTRYLTSVRITYTDICLPFESPKESNTLTLNKE
jgi:uncharacterized protein YehS (DUF1456 family)